MIKETTFEMEFTVKRSREKIGDDDVNDGRVSGKREKEERRYCIVGKVRKKNIQLQLVLLFYIYVHRHKLNLRSVKTYLNSTTN